MLSNIGVIALAKTSRISHCSSFIELISPTDIYHLPVTLMAHVTIPDSSPEYVTWEQVYIPVKDEITALKLVDALADICTDQGLKFNQLVAYDDEDQGRPVWFKSEAEAIVVLLTALSDQSSPEVRNYKRQMFTKMATYFSDMPSKPDRMMLPCHSSD